MIDMLITVFFVVSAVVAIFVATGYFWRWLYGVPTTQEETVYVRTDDGWHLAIHHYPAAEATQTLPVLLCHGLSSNRYTFELPGAPSMARFLRSAGCDVWVAELRGSGMSDHPGLFKSDVPYAWGFEDHLLSDVPAIINGVLQHSNAPALHWVGHSMGGMLIQAHLSAFPNAPIASATALGSPVDFSKYPKTILKILAKIRGITKPCPVSPLPFLGKFVAPLAHRLPNFLLSLFYPPNTDRRASAAVIALAAESVTASAVWRDFGRFVDTGSFCSLDGAAYLSGLPSVPVPILVVAGSNDAMAHPESAMATCRMSELAGERKCVVLGKETGCVEDYGHMDLMVGKRGETEVFPHVLEWIRVHDPLFAGNRASSTAPGNPPKTVP